jgi:hypothetical protein
MKTIMRLRARECFTFFTIFSSKLEYVENVALLKKIKLRKNAIGVEGFGDWWEESGAISRIFICVSYQIR